MTNSEYSPFVKLVANLLAQACLNDTAGRETERVFSDAKFFKLFYRDNGHPLFFLFKKNLRVTNIQFPELLALLRCHCKIEGRQSTNFRFVSTNDFREWVSAITYTFNKDLSEKRFLEVSALYSEMFQRTIICDPYFTSCSIFLPPGIAVDLISICGYSGYIHSCGRCLFIRKTDKTSTEHFFGALDTYLENRRIANPDAKKLFFEVYAHEDFTKHDRSVQTELSYGLDDVKIFVEKYHMGSQRLVSVLSDIRSRYEESLIVPDPGDYRSQIAAKQDNPDVDQSRTIWLIKDTSIHSAPGKRFFHGVDSFYICYEQLLKNENPLHIFDENKPGWYSHTTIPHTLMGAMLNIARPVFGGRPLVADPFAGTGTTFLESLKYREDYVNCGDVSPLAELVSKDNLDFFATEPLKLIQFEQVLQNLASFAKLDPQDDALLLFDIEPPTEKAYKVCLSEIARSRKPLEKLVIDVAGMIADWDFKERIVAYVCLRAKVRGGAALERQSMNWPSAVIKEAKELESQVRRLREQRESEATEVSWTDGKNHVPTGLILFQGEYSYCTSIPTSVFRDALVQTNVVSNRDCRDLPRTTFDLVISDPPYGFNTDDEAFELGTLWAQVFEKMLHSLKPNWGQLVVCLPDHTHVGRQLHFFTNKQFVTHHVLTKSEENNLRVLRTSDIVPKPLDIFRPPYFWESERALRRSILHFVLNSSEQAHENTSGKEQ